MKSLARAFERRAVEQIYSLKDPALHDLFNGGHRSVIGANVTPENALRISGWYAGIRIISSNVGKTPLITYRRLKVGKERAVDHPVYSVLHDQPNPLMTSMEFFQMSQGHLLGRGNCFSLIERNGAGKVIALWPMHPSRMRLEVISTKTLGTRIIYFHYPNGGGEERFSMDDVLHVRGLSSDGILGYSPVDLMREALGLAKVEEEYRARFFKSDARPLGIVEYPGKMSDQAYERFKADWQNTYGGTEKKVAFLEAGLKWHNVGFTPEAAEFIEGRKFQLEEIARILGVPLILLQSQEKSTSWGSGISEILRAFLEGCLLDWFTSWAKRINVSLFTPTERKIYYVEHELKNYLRGDPKTEAEVLQIERRNGVINADSWLEITNRNPLPDGQGQVYVIESNMQRLDQVGEDLDELEPALNGNGNGASSGKMLNGAAK